MKTLRKIIQWFVVLFTTDIVALAKNYEELYNHSLEQRRMSSEIELRLNEKLVHSERRIIDAKEALVALQRHPLLAYLREPKTWRPDPNFEPGEIEAIKTFFASSAGRKMDVAMHNIAMRDMQLAWSCPASEREFQIGAAQGRLAAWVTAKTLSESLTPQSQTTEDSSRTSEILEQLRP